MGTPPANSTSSRASSLATKRLANAARAATYTARARRSDTARKGNAAVKAASAQRPTATFFRRLGTKPSHLLPSKSVKPAEAGVATSGAKRYPQTPKCAISGTAASALTPASATVTSPVKPV